MNKWLTKNVSWLVPVVVTAIVSIPLIFWLSLDSSLPHWDMGRHLFTTIQYQNLWKELLSGEKNIFGLAGFYAYYPPVIYNVVQPFYRLFGNVADAAVYSNIFWIFILVFSIFNISAKLYGKKAGIIALLFILSSPILIGQMREFQVDFPLTAIFSLSMYFLMLSSNFANKKYSVLFGITAGAGMLVKWTFIAYAGPAAGLFFLLGLIKNDRRKIVITNFLIALLIGLLICVYWYNKNIDSIKNDFSRNGISVAKIEGDPTGFSREAFFWYLDKIAIYYLYLPLLFLFAISLINIFRKKEFYKKSWPFLLLLIVYYCVFSFLPNKDTRYIMPALIPIVILASSLIEGIRNKMVMFSVGALFMLIFILNNVSVAYGEYFNIRNNELILFNNEKLRRFGIVISDKGGYTSASPKQNVCPMQEIVNNVPTGQKTRLIGDDQIRMNDWGLAYFLTKDGKLWAGQQQLVLDLDYLVIKNGPAFMFSSSDVRDKVKIINQYKCTDGYMIYLTKVEK